MELKNILGITNSDIIRFLISAGFKYSRYINGQNYGWQRYFYSRDNFNVYVHCDFENKKLSIYKGSYKEIHDEEFKLIPDELIERDNSFEFIDWLDEVCEPYLD